MTIIYGYSLLEANSEGTIKFIYAIDTTYPTFKIRKVSILLAPIRKSSKILSERKKPPENHFCSLLPKPDRVFTPNKGQMQIIGREHLQVDLPNEASCEL